VNKSESIRGSKDANYILILIADHRTVAFLSGHLIGEVADLPFPVHNENFSDTGLPYRWTILRRFTYELTEAYITLRENSNQLILINDGEMADALEHHFF